MQRQIAVTRNGSLSLLTEINSLVPKDKVTIRGHGQMTYAGGAGREDEGRQMLFLRNGNPKTNCAISVEIKFVTKGTRKDLVLTRRYTLGGGESDIYQAGQRMLQEAGL